MTDKVDQYWAQFPESLPGDAERPRLYDTVSFGTSKESAGAIAALVLEGVKTATGALQWVYAAEGKPIPQAGNYGIVTDGEGEPVCVIQDVEVRIIPHNEVDPAFAWDGGEEDRSLESWRRIYWDYIVLECGRIRREPAADTPLVCGRFRVVYREPLRTE
jgi:uncharacterized protein YhfF